MSQRTRQAVAELRAKNGGGHGQGSGTAGRRTVWLCGACGRQGPTRDKVGDESCYLNAVEVYEDSIKRSGNGVSATAASSPIPKAFG